MTRVGFWRQVERFFGPPSHALTAVRAVYIARSSGRCVVCGVKPETGLKLARLDPRLKQRTGWSLVAWVLRNDYPATMGMACSSCIARRGQDWSKPREKNAKARERAASRARQRAEAAAPRPPAPAGPDDFVDPAKIVWTYAGPNPDIERVNGCFFGVTRVQVDGQWQAVPAVIPKPEPDGLVTVAAISTRVDVNDIHNGRVGLLPPKHARLERVPPTDVPPAGWAWFIERDGKLILWKHPGPDHVEVLPLLDSIAPAVVRQYSFSTWRRALEGSLPEGEHRRIRHPEVREMIAGWPLAAPSGNRRLPRWRQDTRLNAGWDLYVMENGRDCDPPKLWKRGSDAPAKESA